MSGAGFRVGWCIEAWNFGLQVLLVGFGLFPTEEAIVNPRKLEHGFRMISAGIPYTLPQGQEENDVPTFWLLLYTCVDCQRPLGTTTLSTYTSPLWS